MAELKTTICEGIVQLEIRKRSARIQILQNQLDGMLELQRARALEYAGHPEGATGMVMKDYRGQKAQKEIWKFDAALEAQILHTLKQAAIEEGQWNEKRPLSSEVGISEITRRLNAGRDRCAAAKRAADEKTKHDAAAALSRPPAS
jgi:hypothetical protein